MISSSKTWIRSRSSGNQMETQYINWGALFLGQEKSQGDDAAFHLVNYLCHQVRISSGKEVLGRRKHKERQTRLSNFLCCGVWQLKC